MPEGHTLHRLATELSTAFGGLVVASSSPQGRFGGGATLVDGRVLAGAEAWGKHMLVTFDG
ncbi:MAG: Formamidopyrimidine-DNA glycolase [Aeromicrobium sp.]|nr:Formamidopyrimidine-DNA glycolase [Aeromicrobium sp.]